MGWQAKFAISFDKPGALSQMNKESVIKKGFLLTGKNFFSLGKMLEDQNI